MMFGRHPLAATLAVLAAVLDMVVELQRAGLRRPAARTLWA